jgi:formylglycine-generating enzyme required for sulfatase activity
MCGNVSDWCLDPFSPEGPAVHDGRATLPEDATASHDSTRRAYRGGAWFGTEAGARLASRNGVDAIFRNDYLGLRLARRAPG